MTEALGAGPGERTADRVGYRSGYYSRGLVPRIGKLELRVPRDREGRFSTALFARYQRSEKALVSALAEMYVQGVSTRKVKAITEELCGHTFSASTVSRINKSLDALLRRFAQRRLDEAYPYVILDARYEKVRLDGVIQSQAVFIALGINEEGRRQVLGVELSNASHNPAGRRVKGLKTRGLQGVEFVVSDDHAGIKRAVRELLPEAVWQRCYVHFLRNALDYLPRKADDDCRQELRWLYDRRNLKEAQQDLQAWLTRWEQRYRSSPTGSKPTSGRRSTSTACPASTTSISRVRTCLNGSTRRSNGGPGSCGSSRIPPAASGWSAPCVPRPTRAGSKITVT